MTVLCMICGENCKNDQDYLNHMQTAHSGKSQLEAMNEEKLKKQNTPPIVPLQKDAPLPPEFEAIVNEIDNPVPQEPPKSSPPVNKLLDQSGGEPKKLELKYKWEGRCPTCNTEVRTVITKVDGRWFAGAFCLSHEIVEQREVTPLEGKIGNRLLISDLTPAIREEVKDGGQSNISKASRPQRKVRPLSETNPESISSKS